MSQRLKPVLLALIISFCMLPMVTAQAQMNDSLRKYLRDTVGLREDQIAEIENGRPLAKAMPTRSMAEVYLVGVININATPESYARLATDPDSIRKLAGSIGLGTMSATPTMQQLAGFKLSEADAQSLAECRPASCQLQLTQAQIVALQNSVRWKTPEANEQVNRFMQQMVRQMLASYQRDGNAGLGTYDDKVQPTDVAHEFASMLENDKALPPELHGFYDYMLNYPRAKPTNVDESFYWSSVKFGFKPTLRVVHELTLHGGPQDAIAVAIARKQIYSSHYFKTALDFSYCVRANKNDKRGFMLVMVLSSETGLEGLYGSFLHVVGVKASLTQLDHTLTQIKTTLENEQKAKN